MVPILQAIALGKSYQIGAIRVDALRGVDLAVSKGDFVAIMGPSGSGKSTLLHLLGGLDTPTTGDVLLDGQRLARLDDDEVTQLRRRRIGFIFQLFNLLPTLSAVENVALPLLLDGRSLDDYADQITDLLRLVGLDDRRDHKPDQLSGGQQQRVAIARALINEPAVVLADEPTGNLDSQAGAEILELLRRAREDKGQTIVMVTHDAQAAQYADRVLQLKDGQLLS